MLRLFVGVLIASLLPAGTAAHAEPGFSSPFQIATIFPREFGIDFITTGAVTGPMGCTRTDTVRLVASAPNYDAIASVLVTAFAGDKTVTVWINSCDSDGTGIIAAVMVDR